MNLEFFFKRLFVLWLTLTALAMEGQTGPHLRFKRLTMRDGLSQVSVSGILQDSRGYMWFTSDDGLNRYDGYQIEVYRSSTRDDNTLSDSSITSLMEDNSGQIWLATEYGGLLRFDKGLGVFSRIGSNGNQRIYCLAEEPDRNGDILWLGTDAGLYRVEADRNVWRQISLIDRRDPGNPEPSVRGMTFSDPKTLWLGTGGQGLLCYDLGRGALTGPVRGGSSIDPYINALLFDRDGQLWIGTQSALTMLRPEDGTVYSHRHHLNVDWSLSDGMVMSLCQDVSGLLWIGTWNGGVNSAVIRPGPFQNTFNVPGDPSSLINDNVRDVLVDRRGNLWVGTAAGLERQDRNAGGWIHYQPDSSSAHALCYQYISDLYEDGAGTLWVGTQRGLSRYNHQTDRFVSFRHDPRDSRSLSSSNIQRLIDDPSDPNQFLLVGTRDNGLNRMNKQTGDCERFMHDEKSENSIGGNWVYAILPRSPERIWLGTFERGLGLWDPVRGRFRHFDRRFTGAHRNDRISCLSADPGEDESILWIGTWGQGLRRFDEREENFRSFTMETGFPSNLISGIVADAKGWFWISTPQGIVHFDPTSEEFSKYDVLVGNYHNAFSAGSNSISPQGEIFFGGLYGFTRFFPELVTMNPFRPPMVLTSLKVMDRELVSGRTSGLPTQLNLSHRDRLLSIQFSALAYTKPSRNQYRFRLQGFDQDWQTVSAQYRTATYTNLSPGSYRFHAQGSNEDGVWNEQGLVLDIVVSPPFWNSWWLRGLVLLLLAVGVLGGVQFRLSRMKRRERELEGLVEQRTCQLSRINRLIQTINAETDISGLLYAILREISAFFPVDRASALTWNRAEGLFRFMVPYNYEQQDMRVSALTQKEARERYSEGTEELAPDLFRVSDVEGRVGHEKLCHVGIARVLLVFRIPGDENVEGYLILENLNDSMAFSAEHEVDLLKRLRDPVVMAFKKAKMMQDLGEQREAAEKANLLKSRFLANMSHEIRTPMNAILGFTHLLSKDELEPQRLEQLQIIGRAGENLLNLINDILDFSKIESEMIEIVPVTFSLRKMLRHLEALFRLPAEEKELYFRLTVQDRVPRFLFGDSFRLNQVLVNIVGNAVKFTRKGGITIHADYQDGILHLAVQDTGIGIPQEKQALIFQPFIQADDSTTREYGGTGLGLSICHKVMTLMQGDIALDSRLGEGSVFNLRLPMDPVSQAEIQAEGLWPNQESASWTDGEKVLGIIEDKESDLALLQAILKRNGYEVVELENSAAVVDQVLTLSVDLVLLDIVMNGMDGMAVNELLKKDVRTAHIPVIAVSGTRRTDECMNFGILDFIRKPVREDELLKRIFVTLSVPQCIHNVYVVDDDPVMVALYGAFLRRFHYNTFTFGNARDALDSLDLGIVPDVIILDLMMPKMSGFDFLKALKERHHLQAPVIVVTAKDLSAAEMAELRKDTLAIFPKGMDTGMEFISFLDGYFQRRDGEGRERLRRWQEHMDSPEIRSLLMEALDSLPQRVKDLGKAVHDEDWLQAAQISHDLKGLCANMGITEISGIAHEINGLVRSETGMQLEHLERLMVELNLIVVAVPRARLLDAFRFVEGDNAGPKDVRILVVEDEPINRRLLEIYISRLNHRCDSAANGAEALEMMQLKRYDLIFLDIQMPVLSGLDVLARIREDDSLKECCVVVLTAHAIKGDEEKYLAAGCDAYLPKPVKQESIEQMISFALERKRSD